MKESELRKIIREELQNESLIHSQLFETIKKIIDVLIPQAIKKMEREEKTSLTKSQRDKITKAEKLLDQAYGLLYNILE